MGDFPTKCKHCGAPWKWEKDFAPPPGSNRANEGKDGWWSVDGKPHYQDQCDTLKAQNKGSSTITTTAAEVYIDDVPNAAPDAKVDEAGHIYAMCLAKAHEHVKARYPKGHPAQGAIRADVTSNYVRIYCELIRKETIDKQTNK